VGQNLRFLRPVHPGDLLAVTVTVASLDAKHHRAVLDTRCVDQDGQIVIEGQAEVVPPREKLRIHRTELPDVLVADKNLRYGQLLTAAQAHEAITMAVVHPCSREALEGAIEAGQLGLITPVLVGPEAKIRTVAADNDLDIGTLRIVDVPHSHAAAQKAVAMALAGEVHALMKGSLHTDELMGAVVAPDGGLRTGRRMSHIFVLDVPRYPKPLLVTDAAINIEPDFEAKADIVRNAIDLAHALGIAQPKVAILSAVETVTPKMRSSMDAAALCKMVDRGQITGAVLDGPLAFDNAISAFAAGIKGIHSEVSGDADILVVPNLEAGNMVAKQLEYLADAQAAGVVLGAKVPIVLTSRADSAHSRVASCAVALLAHHHAKAN
jgi:phosphotransacetylase